MVERYAQGSYGMTPTKDGDFVKYHDYKEALAEKDREISQLTQSTEMLRYALQGIQDQYQQLMEQAVRFAQIICNDRACTYGGPEAAHQASLVYRTAEAFLKERA